MSGTVSWERLLRQAGVGLSARAIGGEGSHHPHDPSDLVRCVAYCQHRGITSLDFMRTRSTAWARLVPEWGRLVELLRDEVEMRTDGMAPQTYFEIQRVIAGGVVCEACKGTKRVSDCEKCKGSGRRSGGRCRACYGSGIDEWCGPCRGKGFTVPEVAA